jgi:hypothetical protein
MFRFLKKSCRKNQASRGVRCPAGVFVPNIETERVVNKCSKRELGVLPSGSGLLDIGSSDVNAGLTQIHRGDHDFVLSAI